VTASSSFRRTGSSSPFPRRFSGVKFTFPDIAYADLAPDWLRRRAAGQSEASVLQPRRHWKGVAKSGEERGKVGRLDKAGKRGACLRAGRDTDGGKFREKSVAAVSKKI
jgi:hypothetical protein